MFSLLQDGQRQDVGRSCAADGLAAIGEGDARAGICSLVAALLVESPKMSFPDVPGFSTLEEGS